MSVCAATAGSTPAIAVLPLGNYAISPADFERPWRGHWREGEWDLTRAVKYALDEAGIVTLYPHRQVVLSDLGARLIPAA